MKVCCYVLAAGVGSRLRPLTETTPKPLVEISGRACIDWILLRLRKEGFKNIFVNVCYLKDKLINHLKKNWPEVTIIEEENPSETGGAIKANPYLVDFDLTLVHNGDTLTGISFQNLIKHHINQSNDVTLACNYNFHDRFVSFYEEKLSGWGSLKNRRYYGFISNIKKHYLGINVMNKEVLNLFYTCKETKFSIFLVYSNPRVKVGSFDDESFWLDVGTNESLQLINSISDLDSKLGLT